MKIFTYIGIYILIDGFTHIAFVTFNNDTAQNFNILVFLCH